MRSVRKDHQNEDWMVESPFPNGTPDTLEDEDGGAMWKKEKPREV